MVQLWANSTWSLFHTLTANIIEELFDEAFKNECIDLFTKITRKSVREGTIN